MKSKLLIALAGAMLLISSCQKGKSPLVIHPNSAGYFVMGDSVYYPVRCNADTSNMGATFRQGFYATGWLNMSFQYLHTGIYAAGMGGVGGVQVDLETDGATGPKRYHSSPYNGTIRVSKVDTALNFQGTNIIMVNDQASANDSFPMTFNITTTKP